MTKELNFADILEMDQDEYAAYKAALEAAMSPEEKAAQQEEYRLLMGGEEGDGYV